MRMTGAGPRGHLVSDGNITSFSDLADDRFELLERVPRGSSAEVVTDDPAVVLSALATLDSHAAEVALLPGGTGHPDAGAIDRPVPEVRLTGSAAARPGPTSWALLTSGTSGAPKRVHHSLESLTRTIRDGSSDPTRIWGLLYQPTRMAGLQVLLHCLVTGESLVAPPAEAHLSGRIEMLRTGGVTALSATPAMWRRMLQLGADDAWPLQQITLGGEIADQALLDELRRRFPSARITHVFAATESGVAFSVNDGRAGFPASFLEEAPGGIEIRVADGELLVRNGASSVADPDGFVRTGDLVEIVGDRVHFLGRSSGVVNIAGANIWPEQVEDLLRAHPAVMDAVVAARANPFAGNLLIADVMLRRDVDPVEPAELRRWVRDRATPAHVPARVTVVHELAMTPTGKVRRA